MGTCMASMIVPTTHMPFPPPRARGEGARWFSRRGARESGAAGQMRHGRVTALGDTVEKSA
eukprot:scaffold16800_cov58-Phaeocystis_antarctica.AAC.6